MMETAATLRADSPAALMVPRSAPAKTIRIASCPKPRVNAYYALYYGALARFGVEVEYVHDIMRTPIAESAERAFDAVHFHWGIERMWRSFGRSTAAQLYGLTRWSRFLRNTKQAGISILWTAHELSPPDGGTRIDALGYRFCAQAADLCLCHSEVCRQQVIDLFGVARAKTLVIPHGTYDGVLVPTQSREATCDKWGLPANRRLLLCFGAQRPRKGLEVALESMRRVDPDCHLVIQASTPSSKVRRWMSGLCDAHRTSPNVSFLQQELDDSDLANLLAASDCVVLPYLDIVGSGALAACLTVGCGVVVSDLPYFREALGSEPDVGVFFPPGHAPALAAAVTTFFSMDLSRRQAAAKRLASGLRWDSVVTPVGEWLQAHCA